MKIRKSAFETNSSSSHSFTLDPDWKLIPADRVAKRSISNGRLEVDCSIEFGWGYDTYTGFNAKAAYLRLGCVDKSLELEKLENIIKSYLGIEEISWVHTDQGYIDHQSAELPYRILSMSDEDIRNFLFSNSSELEIDNDNR